MEPGLSRWAGELTGLAAIPLTCTALHPTQVDRSFGGPAPLRNFTVIGSGAWWTAFFRASGTQDLQ